MKRLMLLLIVLTLLATPVLADASSSGVRDRFGVRGPFFWHPFGAAGGRGDGPASADGARPERLLLRLQPRQEEHLPRSPERQGQGGLRRAGAEVRHRAGELSPRRDGRHGLRLRAAARIAPR